MSVLGLDGSASALQMPDTGEADEEVLAALRAGASPETLALIDEVRHPSKPSWTSQVGLLALSLLLFVSIGLVQWSFAEIVLLVAVLLVHEGGHYLAMQAFGYRDVRMFFIPLFGAAVSGYGDEAPGHQRTLVALAGPLPGVLLGTALGFVNLVVGQPLLADLAKMFLFLNIFNLLPLLPLDGGHVMQVTLFGRNPKLEAGFQVVAAGCLLMLAVAWGAWLLGLLCVMMLLGVSRIVKIGRVVAQLRSAGEPIPAGALRNGPLHYLVRVVEEMDAVFVGETRPAVRRANLEAVLEKLGRRSPGAMATMALLAVYATTFVIALIGAVVVMAPRAPQP